MNALRLAQMLGVVNVFIGLTNTATLNLLIGLAMAVALYLDRS